MHLSRREASEAVADLGWRYLLGNLRTCVPVPSMDRAAEVGAIAVDACGPRADAHLSVDLRPRRVVLTLRTAEVADLTRTDLDLARRVSAALERAGARTVADTGDGAGGAPRAVQMLEIAVDALRPERIRPFWKAVLGYVCEPGHDGPRDPLVDPLGQGPAVWFQQMEHPRPQRNRIHFDVCVPHDEARARLRAALGAGGVLVAEERAPAFWVLADAEGNEVCVTTWQNRD
ncbi:VOC family protein [Nocardiopsis terrae]